MNRRVYNRPGAPLALGALALLAATGFPLAGAYKIPMPYPPANPEPTPAPRRDYDSERLYEARMKRLRKLDRWVAEHQGQGVVEFPRKGRKLMEGERIVGPHKDDWVEIPPPADPIDEG